MPVTYAAVSYVTTEREDDASDWDPVETDHGTLNIVSSTAHGLRLGIASHYAVPLQDTELEIDRYGSVIAIDVRIRRDGIVIDHIVTIERRVSDLVPISAFLSNEDSI